MLRAALHANPEEAVGGMAMGNAKTVEHFLGTSLHDGPIVGLSLAVRKPIVATAGAADKSVRVWNFKDYSLDILKVFPEEPVGVTLHPGGFQIAVGFADKVKLMNIVTSELRALRDIVIKGSRELKFSHGGHLLACVNNSSIHVYKTYTGELHVGRRG